MPRSVTVQLPDGSSQVYEGVPDNVTDAQVQERATTDFGVEKVGSTLGGLGKAAHVGGARGAKMIPHTMAGAEKVLPPTQQMLLGAMRKLTPESQDKTALSLKSLDSDYVPQGAPERFTASISESVVGGLPFGGTTPAGLVVNSASGILGQLARENKMGATAENLLPMAPALTAAMAHLISPRTAVKELRTAVDKLPPGAMNQGREVAARGAERGVPLLPGQAVPPGAGETKTTLESLTEAVRKTPQGGPLQNFLHSQDDQLAALERARGADTRTQYAAGMRTRPAPNDPELNATQLELQMMGPRRAVAGGGQGDAVVRDINNRADANLYPRTPGGPVPASHTALNNLSRELRERAQQLGPNTVEGGLYTDASVRVKRLAEQSPDVAEANRIYAEYSELLRAGGRAREGMAHANPVTMGDAAQTAPVIGSALAGAGSVNNPANVGWALTRPFSNMIQRGANKQLASALGDPTFQRLDTLLNKSKSRDIMLEVLRGYQANQIQGKE